MEISNTGNRFVFLRNIFSHLKTTTLRKRHDGMAQFRHIAELLNTLFK